MLSLRLSRKARQEIKEIWSGIAMENRRAADRLLARLFKKMRRLPDFPEIGTTRADVGPNMRMLVEGKYIILYTIEADAIRIVRVLHGARDPATW